MLEYHGHSFLVKNAISFYDFGKMYIAKVINSSIWSL